MRSAPNVAGIGDVLTIEVNRGMDTGRHMPSSGIAWQVISEMYISHSADAVESKFDYLRVNAPESCPCFGQGRSWYAWYAGGRSSGQRRLLSPRTSAVRLSSIHIIETSIESASLNKVGLPKSSTHERDPASEKTCEWRAKKRRSQLSSILATRCGSLDFTGDGTGILAA